MLTRIISGAVLVAVLVVVLLFLPVKATEIAVGLVAALALYEFYRAVLSENGSLKGKLPLVVAGYIFGLSLLFADTTMLLPVISLGFVLIMVLTVLFHKKIAFRDSAAAYFGAVYVFALIRHITMTRQEAGGVFLVIAIFIGAFVTDTGAYFVGSFLGKHKLAAAISPKKTVEGSVGGILVTELAFMLYGYVGKYFIHYDINFVNLAIIAIVLSVVSQLGDLCASVVKRELDIKDYGNIIPGHGGILDRFDSVLFVAPVFYYMNSILPVFVIK